MISYEMATARAWAEINIDDILSNYRCALDELKPGVAHYAVLKANAYGLGAAPLARILYRDGARLFATACVAEAVEVARALPDDREILIMGETFPAEMDLLFDYRLTPTLMSEQSARILSEKAGARGVTLPFHCKVDTGLHRLGFSVDEAPAAIERIVALPNLRFAGLFSHLQRRSREYDRVQIDRLIAVRGALTARGVSVPLAHMLDSIGMWRYPECQLGAVRDGAFLFGHTQPDYPRSERLRFSLSVKTRVARIHWAEPGECLGYDATHPLTRRTRVATLTIGYADGYPRAMSFVGQAEIHGKRASVLGVVCMDLTMVDVTEIPEAEVGDIATMLGGSIHIDEYADFSNGYRNEYMAMLSRRMPRVYLRAGKAEEIAWDMMRE